MKSILIFTNLIFSLSAFRQNTDLYIVGDSLSDNGNTFELTDGERPNPRIYPSHRYSNGPVWNEYLARKYRKLNLKNYAIGGATTDNSVLKLDLDSPSLKDQAIDISNEFKEYPELYSSNRRTQRLAVVFGGGNDFAANATLASQTIIPNLLKITDILRETKMFDNILVFNLVNLVKTPFGNSLPTAQKEGLNQIINYLNQALEKAINDLQAKDPSQKLTYIDADELTGRLINTPPKNSLKWEPLNFCVDNSKPDTTEICKYPQDSFFWDNRHPNTFSHERIANELIVKFKQLNIL